MPSLTGVPAAPLFTYFCSLGTAASCTAGREALTYVFTWKECSGHSDSDVESTLVSACTAAASRGDLTAQGTLGTTSVIQQVPTSVPPTSEGGGGRYQPPPAGSEHFCSRATPARTSSGETGAARHLGSTRSTRSPGHEGPLPAGSLLKV